MSLARDIISGAGLTTSSLALLDNSMTLNGGGNGLTPSHKSTPNRRSSTTRYFLGDTAAQKASPNTNRGELENERGRSHMNVMLNDVPRRARSVSPLSLSARSSGREEGLRPGQRRYSHSVSPTSRRARAQDEQKRIKNELLNKTRPHSEQYQRVKMMREVKSSMLNNRDTKAPAAVYAFGSSTTSARNIANRPSTETRDEIIYNPDHYLPHQHSMFQSVPSYGYGQHKPSGPSRNRIPAVAKTSSNRQAGYLNPTHSSYARQSSAASQPNLKRSPTISRSNSGNTLGDRDRNSQNYRKKENYPGNSGLPSKSSFSDSKSSFDENSYNASDIYLETAAPHHVPRTMEFPSSVGSKTRQPKPPPRTISKAGSSSYNGTVNGTYEVGKPPKGMDKAQWLLINGIDPHQAKNQSFKLRGRTGFK